MTTLVGLDLGGRRVVVVGAGPVEVRRVRRFLADGALVTLVDPDPCDEARRVASHGDMELVEQPVRRRMIKGAWLVVAATSDPVLNARVAGWAQRRRIWCVDASDGSSELTNLRPRSGGAGKVILVGSGPGDPGLVTVAAREALASAHVVVTDRLGATGLLDQLPSVVEVIEVGKSPGNHPVTQEQINQLLITHARAGRTVVRFKGGDPYLFGRGGEEVHACRAAGVRVEVIPGVSSAFSVPALAGIPVTQRGVTSSVLVSSGHTGPDTAVLAALREGATVVLLMAVASLSEICRAASAAGVPADLPVAIIEQGSTSRERVTRATVATAAHVATREGVRPPAIIVLGLVASEGFLDDPICATRGPVLAHA